jgi:hypothetical protein
MSHGPDLGRVSVAGNSTMLVTRQGHEGIINALGIERLLGINGSQGM